MVFRNEFPKLEQELQELKARAWKLKVAIRFSRVLETLLKMLLRQQLVQSYHATLTESVFACVHNAFTEVQLCAHYQKDD